MVADGAQRAHLLCQYQEGVGKGRAPGEPLGFADQPFRQAFHKQHIARREAPVVERRRSMRGRGRCHPGRGPGPGCSLTCRRGHGADSDVVRVAVAAVRAKGYDGVRPEVHDDVRHFIYESGKIGVGQSAVEVVQTADLRNTEPLAGEAQFSLADGANAAPSAYRTRRGSGPPALASLTRP